MCLLYRLNTFGRATWGGSNVVLGPLNISSGKCCKTVKQPEFTVRTRHAYHRLKQINLEAFTVTLKTIKDPRA